MIVYHGSNMLIEMVELHKCRPYKDFGRGFYCTTIKNRAELMAKRVTTIFGGIPCVTAFDLDESIFIKPGMRIKKFEGPSKDWALFVLNNRNKSFSLLGSIDCNHDNKYDHVIGPIANDDLALLFRTFINGFIDLDALIKGMKYKKLTDQCSFHTDKALQYLKFVGGI